MNRPPAFQFYPKDWLDFKVQRMSLAAQGVYLKLLCFMWTDSRDQCSMLDDDELLARALGITLEQWVELRKELQHDFEPLFEAKDGRLVSARLHHEAIKQRKYRRQQSIKGSRSAQQRVNRGSTVVQPMHQPEGNSSSSSSSSILKNKNTSTTRAQADVLNGHRNSFEVFWTQYPRKRNKGAAEKVWGKLQPDPALLTVMLGKIEQAKQTIDWQKSKGQYIPYPATWLNGKGWEDDFSTMERERLPL